MAVMVFLMPLNQIFIERAEAVVVSKVVTKAAKKVAKEVATDTAVQMSMNMVINYKYKPKDDRKPVDSYSFVCMPRDKKSNGDCAKPLQVKTKLDDRDVRVLKSEIEDSLDKKIAGGVMTTKWGKFLDWFIPIWSVGMGVAIVDYAMNGEVSDLFDELAYEALVKFGFIIPSTPTPVEPKPPGEGGGGIEIPEPETPPINDGGIGTVPPPFTPEFAGLLSDLGYSNWYGQHRYSWQPTNGNLFKTTDTTGKLVYLTEITFYYEEWDPYTKPRYAKSIRVRGYDQISNEYVYTVDKDFAEGTVAHPDMKASTWEEWTRTLSRRYVPTTIVLRESLLPVTEPIPEVPPVPKFNETDLPRTVPQGTPIKVPAPGSIPFEEVGTGEQLIPFKKPDGTIGFKTRTGVEVLDPDKVEVKDPVITDNPDGSKTVKKQPTGEVPNPSPNEDGKIPPKTDTDPPPTDPETGESCERLKRPDFKPLSSAITTSFPFSIPWDLHRAFSSAFSEIGDSRPEFSYKFDFNGKSYDWKISMPQFFDSWMPFVRGLLLLGFDIGLVYAIYRFTRGGD